tara:strand:+ start:346 stop:522 length:177 start_codon:yes stop_codon:yes gene_type:complete
MRESLVKILACPVCKSSLSLVTKEIEDDEIVSGVLHCPSCDHDYLIENTIPNLLPPEK